METLNFEEPIDTAIQDGLDWLTDNAAWFFGGLQALFDLVFDNLEALLLWPPAWLVIVLVGALGWWATGRSFAIFAVLGLLLCLTMGLWDETMSTFALVLASVALALSVAIPVGIVTGLEPRLNDGMQFLMDLIQTMPPYIYLLPGIALIGYGPATAVAATILVSIAPALRLTAIGIKLTPREYIELGRANGASPLQMLFKIRLPMARASIMAGINQSLMVGVGMVVIAGIVGSGGLGQTVYQAIRTLDIGEALDAGIAIVIMTIILDRISQGFGSGPSSERAPA